MALDDILVSAPSADGDRPAQSVPQAGDGAVPKIAASACVQDDSAAPVAVVSEIPSLLSSSPQDDTTTGAQATVEPTLQLVTAVDCQEGVTVATGRAMAVDEERASGQRVTHVGSGTEPVVTTSEALPVQSTLPSAAPTAPALPSNLAPTGEELPPLVSTSAVSGVFPQPSAAAIAAGPEPVGTSATDAEAGAVPPSASVVMPVAEGDSAMLHAPPAAPSIDEAPVPAVLVDGELPVPVASGEAVVEAPAAVAIEGERIPIPPPPTGSPTHTVEAAVEPAPVAVDSDPPASRADAEQAAVVEDAACAPPTTTNPSPTDHLAADTAAAGPVSPDAVFTTDRVDLVARSPTQQDPSPGSLPLAEKEGAGDVADGDLKAGSAAPLPTADDGTLVAPAGGTTAPLCDDQSVAAIVTPAQASSQHIAVVDKDVACPLEATSGCDSGAPMSLSSTGVPLSSDAPSVEYMEPSL